MVEDDNRGLIIFCIKSFYRIIQGSRNLRYYKRTDKTQLLNLKTPKFTRLIIKFDVRVEYKRFMDVINRPRVTVPHVPLYNIFDNETKFDSV